MSRYVLHETLRVLLVTLVTLVGVVGYGLHGWLGCGHGLLTLCGTVRCPAQVDSQSYDAVREAHLSSRPTVQTHCSEVEGGRCVLCDFLASYQSTELLRPVVSLADVPAESAAPCYQNFVSRTSLRMPPTRGPPKA